MALKEGTAKEVREVVLRYIAAGDPCCFDSIMAECQWQIAEIERIGGFKASIILDAVLNNCIKAGKIRLSSVYDTESGTCSVVFELC